MIAKVLYTVKDIQGDYGILVDEQGNENSVAMFFLPDNLSVGSKIIYENLEYSLIEK